MIYTPASIQLVVSQARLSLGSLAHETIQLEHYLLITEMIFLLAESSTHYNDKLTVWVYWGF